MNALNILSGGPPSPSRSRASSASNINDVYRSSKDTDPGLLNPAYSTEANSSPSLLHPAHSPEAKSQEDDQVSFGSDGTADEKSHLLQDHEQSPEPFPQEKRSSWIRRISKRIADAVAASIKVVLTAIAAPALYVVSFCYDDQGNLSVMVPVRRMFRSSRGPRASPAGMAHGVEKEGYHEKPRLKPKDEGTNSSTDTTERDSSREHSSRERSQSVDSTTTALSESESERSTSVDLEDSPARNTRSRTTSKDEIAPAKRSIRIKLHNEEALKRKRARSRASNSAENQADKVAAVANSLKSPSSPASASATKLKYPRAAAAPRPLVPRRQPSYTFTHSPETPKKTLIIDLDETLIHSMAKGGRMSTGHMVEVKFQGPIGGNGVVLGPQVPILYYVHERPYCHEFLRKVRGPSSAKPRYCYAHSSFTRSASGTI